MTKDTKKQWTNYLLHQGASCYQVVTASLMSGVSLAERNCRISKTSNNLKSIIVQQWSLRTTSQCFWIPIRLFTIQIAFSKSNIFLLTVMQIGWQDYKSVNNRFPQGAPGKPNKTMVMTYSNSNWIKHTDWIKKAYSG